MESIKSQLTAMGFSESKITQAIKSNPEAQNLEQIMEWLIAHEDELDSAGPSSSSRNSIAKVTQSMEKSGETSSSNGPKAVDNLSTDELKPNETAAETAARKKITAEEAQRLIIERQAIRAEEERKKEIEDEKKRRQEGQKLIQTRAELEDQERIRLAQQIRREKLEKELHRKKILEQIALDRENMKNKTNQAEPPVKSASSSNSASKGPAKASSTECKLALRFPDGSTKVHKFSHQEQLAAVRLFVQMEKTSSQDMNIQFIAPPNKKLSEAHMQQTLEDLGLCPASRLEVKYAQQAEVIDLD